MGVLTFPPAPISNLPFPTPSSAPLTPLPCNRWVHYIGTNETRRDSVPYGEPETRKHIPPKQREVRKNHRLQKLFCSFPGGDFIQVVLKHTQVLGQQNTKFCRSKAGCICMYVTRMYSNKTQRLRSLTPHHEPPKKVYNSRQCWPFFFPDGSQLITHCFPNLIFVTEDLPSKNRWICVIFVLDRTWI